MSCYDWVCGLPHLLQVPCSTGWRLLHVRGDLFTCPSTDALAHCISEDCRMGAGIAVLFKKKFHGVEELQAQSECELSLLTSATHITCIWFSVFFSFV